MKNILIVNLKRFGDILTTANIVNSYICENPKNKVSLLIFKEFERAAKNIANVDQIYTIDREKFLTLHKNKIFSNAFSLNTLINNLSDIKSTQWDIVFNYSNDRVSTHLCSFLKSNTDNTVGISFNKSCSIEYSSEWDIIFNDVLTSYKYAPVNFIDTYHRMANLTKAKRSCVLRTNETHNKSAVTNFGQIRKNSDGTSKKIIGIQITASSERKELEREKLISLIDMIATDERFVPVLLLAPTQLEREKLKSINGEFNNTLISIEADFLALNSVLMNIDLLVTPDTACKHAADLLGTPTIEISLGESPLFKQGVTNEDSLIYTNAIEERFFSIKELNKTKNKNSITAKDIFSGIEYLLEGSSVSELSSGITIYHPVNDKLGTRYSWFAGDINVDAELNRQIGRQFINNFFGMGEDHSIYSDVARFSKESIMSWLNTEKSVLTDFTKDLLGALRSITQDKSGRRGEFIHNLGILLSYCEYEGMNAIAAIVFRARIEALNTSDIEHSSKEIEGLLYELKGDLQKVHKTFKSFEEFIFNKGKEDRISARKENVSSP